MTSIDDLAAAYALTTAKARYCRALDTKDWNTMSSLMTDDIEFGLTDGNMEPNLVTGRAEVLDMLRSLVAGATTVHQVHAPEISVSDDEAQVVWAVHDRAVYAGGVSVTGFGHYRERWVRGSGGWVAASIVLQHLLVEAG